MSYGGVGGGGGGGGRALLGVKVLERAALRATVATEAVVIEAPIPPSRASFFEGREYFTGKAVIAYAGYGALDPSFVTRRPHARRVDVKVPGVGIVEKGRRDAGRQGIGIDDDGLGVIRDDHFEDAAEEVPRGLAGF